MQQISVQHLHWAQSLLDAGDPAVNTTDKHPCPHGAYKPVNIMTCSVVIEETALETWFSES